MAKRLSQEEFSKTFENVPRVALNLLIEDQHGGLLLTKRNILPEEGLWHFPGSFLLKDESLTECLRRIAKDELDYDLRKEPILMGVFENLDKDPRGHVVDIVYKVKSSKSETFRPTSETKEMKFFKKLPGKIGFNHRETLGKLGYT